MEHPAVTHINAHMGNAGGIVCPGEEHQISGLGVTDTGTDVIQPLGTQPPEVPTALIIDPRYIAGAVKGCAGLVPAPYIGIADILLGLLVDGGKGLVGKVFLRDFIQERLGCVFAHIGRSGKQVCAVAKGSHVEGVPGQLFLAHDVDWQMGQVEVFKRDGAKVSLNYITV